MCVDDDGPVLYCHRSAPRSRLEIATDSATPQRRPKTAERGRISLSEYLIIELVEGETLAERLERGAIPLDEALHIAIQIADALEAAHDKGVVHRDLKPANVKITPEGRVKVLDFGLAKISEPLSGSPNAASSDARFPGSVEGDLPRIERASTYLTQPERLVLAGCRTVIERCACRCTCKSASTRHLHRSAKSTLPWRFAIR
jgi:serine/threonine protein kinase